MANTPDPDATQPVVDVLYLRSCRQHVKGNIRSKPDLVKGIKDQWCAFVDTLADCTTQQQVDDVLQGMTRTLRRLLRPLEAAAEMARDAGKAAAATAATAP